MPFPDTVSSVSGRNSRSSNVSAMTGISHTKPAGGGTESTLNPGVLSMLKTSTDTGDIGALSFNHARLPGMSRSSAPRKEHPTRGSGSVPPHTSGSSSAKHRHAPSQASRASSRWETTSHHRRGSLTSMHSMPPSLPLNHHDKNSVTAYPQASENARDSRSYSLTSAPSSQLMPRHLSGASSKSRGHGSNRHHRVLADPSPPLPDSRQQFVYPTRLKRPGFRAGSPALSDTYVQGLSSHGQTHVPPLRPHDRRPSPDFPSRNGTYRPEGAVDFAYDPRYLNVRPYPHSRHAHTPPGMSEYDIGPSQHRVPHPRGARFDGGAPARFMVDPAHHRPVYPANYSGGPPNARPGYQQYSQTPYGGSRGPPPAQANYSQMPHMMFHNAARMARQVPSRAETPMTNLGLDGSSPASDPPSTRSAATPSRPSTPRDYSATPVGVDPAFIDPALADLQDSPSEPLLSVKYFEYADGLYRNPSEAELEAVQPALPTTGFVQRVRAMLESKATVDTSAVAAAKNVIALPNTAPEVVLTEVHELEAGEMQREISAQNQELYELAANDALQYILEEEAQDPVELPASGPEIPQTIPELEVIDATERPSDITSHRITVQMVRTGLGPGSVASDETGNVHEDAAASSTNGERDKQTDDDSADERPPHLLDSRPVMAPPAELSNYPHLPKPRVVSNTTVSGDATLPSEAKYAMRFTSPADSNADSDETQSENPFALDADTMTIEHQNQEAAATAASKKSRLSNDTHKYAVEVTENVTTNLLKVTLDPVSPLGSDENVQRFSAVSPLPSPQIADNQRAISETIADMPGAFPDAEEIASTQNEPQTPKAHVKVAWQRPATDTSDSNVDNHISLPGNTSTFSESTANNTSDVVTDVAIRFTLPSDATANIARPHVDSVSTGPTPEEGNADIPPSLRRGQMTRTSRRTSISFANEVAPLNINKRVEPHQRAQSAGAGPLITGQTITRKPSPLNDAVEISRAPLEQTTDVRLPGTASNFNPPSHSRFGSPQLPGLKEESAEDMSHIHKETDEETPRFPAPNRFAAMRAMQERRLAESAKSSGDGHTKKPRRDTARLFNRPLADTKDLPSLNFSRTDLIDKLNEALEVVPPPRDAKSMEILRPATQHRFSGIFCPSPQRPQSTEPLRERYTSFFCKPEDFSCFDVVDFEDGEGDAVANGEADEDPNGSQDDATPKPNDIGSRPAAQAELLEFASQINRLSIPSVNGLSERLSGLIPGLRNLQNFHFEDILGSSTGRESTGILWDGENMRPGTVLSTRSSGFRALAERAEEIVKNGTHDSIVPKSNTALDKELPPLPGTMSAEDYLAASVAGWKKQPGLTTSVSAPSDLNQGSRPASALTTFKSPATAEEVLDLLPTGMNPIARNAKRSMILSQPSSRPWNLDENYPWAESKVDIDLSNPSESHVRDISGAEKGLGRITGHSFAAGDLSTTHETVDLTTEQQGIDIGSITSATHHNQHDNASITTEQATGASTTSHHHRKHSKRSIIGSITKRIVGGLKSRAPTEDSETLNSTSKSPVPPYEQHTSIDGLPAHRPGDRYPTSGLSPPLTGLNLNLDEVRSFFSDNSSDKEHNSSFRKRLTNLKKVGGGGSHGSKNKGLRLDRSSIRHLHLLHHHHRNASSTNPRHHFHRGHHSFDGTGHTTATSTYEVDPTATTTSLPGTPTTLNYHQHLGSAPAIPISSSTAALATAATTTTTPYPASLGGTHGVVVGMGKTEFHLKRFGEKLRHLLARSGDLFRSFSASAKGGRSGGDRVFAARKVLVGGRRERRGRGREEDDDDEDWLADSVYSGL